MKNLMTNITQTHLNYLIQVVLILLIFIIILSIIIYALCMKYNNKAKPDSLPFFSNEFFAVLAKIIFTAINTKIILFFLLVLSVHYLTPLIVSIIYSINVYIYINVKNVELSIQNIIIKIGTVFIMSCLICIIKSHLCDINMCIKEVSFLLHILLAISPFDNFILSNYGVVGDIPKNHLLLSSSKSITNLSDNSSATKGSDNDNFSENTTPTRGRSPEGGNSDNDRTPTRSLSPNSTRFSARSLSPRSLWRIIDDSMEITHNIRRFFGNTFYIWDRPSEVRETRFKGAIGQAEDSTSSSYVDNDGNVWSNPNGTNYTKEDELRSVINLKNLAKTPLEKANLDRVINSTGGPILFTEDTNGNLIFYRMQK